MPCGADSIARRAESIASRADSIASRAAFTPCAANRKISILLSDALQNIATIRNPVHTITTAY